MGSLLYLMILSKLSKDQTVSCPQETSKQIIFIGLTVPWEEAVQETYERKLRDT